MGLLDFFKKQPSNMEAFAEVAHTLVKTQLWLASINDDSLENDLYSLGYIFGVHDALCQSLGMKGDDEMLSAMSISYEILFGEELGINLLQKSLLNEDALLMKGRYCGGEETVEFVRNGKNPVGLMKHKSS